MSCSVPVKTAGVLWILLAACAASPRHEEDARALVLRFVEASNAHDYALLDELLTPDFTRHCQATPDVRVRSLEDMRRYLEADAAAFPDGRVSLDRVIVDGDEVAFRGSYTGTQAGPVGPFAASGRAMRVDICGTFRIEAGRLAELWISWDNLAALQQLGHWQPPEVPLDSGTYSRDSANKALARVWFEQVINERDLDAIGEHYAADYVHHGSGGAELRGVEAARAFAASILAASSDRVAVVERQVAEGDLVVTHFVSRGTHTGTFRGVEATGKEWTTEGICISRIERGRIAEDWEIVQVSGL